MKPITILNINFVVGANIKECIAEAIKIARQLNLAFVNFEYNEVKFSISQTPGSIEDIIDKYEMLIRSSKAELKYIVT